MAAMTGASPIGRPRRTEASITGAGLTKWITVSNSMNTVTNPMTVQPTRLATPCPFGAQPLFGFAELGRQGVAEVLGLEHLTDFDLGAAAERCALQPLDRLLQR